jgi:hypothetical protein
MQLRKLADGLALGWVGRCGPEDSPANGLSEAMGETDAQENG